MKGRFERRIRSAMISWLAGALNWNSRVFSPRDLFGPIEWRDRVRWFIEGWLSRLFSLAYRNSDEELRDAPDIPEKYWSSRQKAHMEGGAS